MVDIVLQLKGSAGNTPLVAEMTLQGGAMTLRAGLADGAPPITLPDLWGLLQTAFNELGIDLPELPTGGLWKMIDSIGVVPTVWITPSNEKVSGYLELKLETVAS